MSGVAMIGYSKHPITIQTSPQGSAEQIPAPATTAPTASCKARRPRRRTRQAIADIRLSRDKSLAERVMHRRDSLLPAERALLDQVFTLGRPVSSVAELTGERVRAVRLRLKSLLTRIQRPEFDAVVTRSHAWPRQMAAVGAAVFVRGQSVRAAARELAVPYRTALDHTHSISLLAATLAQEQARKGAAA